MVETAAGVETPHSKKCICGGSGRVLDPRPGGRVGTRSCNASMWKATIRVNYDVEVTVYASDEKEARERFRGGDWTETKVSPSAKNWGEPCKVKKEG